jgi:hypothetical protein
MKSFNKNHSSFINSGIDIVIDTTCDVTSLDEFTDTITSTRFVDTNDDF